MTVRFSHRLRYMTSRRVSRVEHRRDRTYSRESAARRPGHSTAGGTALRATEWKRASARLADVLPGFKPIKFGFADICGWVAKCVYVDSSTFSSAAFYIQAFAFPLFIPADHLYFDYGFRVNGRWERVSDELMEEVRTALPQLTSLATLDGLLASAGDWRVNIYQAELRLCIGVLKKDAELVDDSRRAIEAWVPKVAWEFDVIGRSADVVREVDANGYEGGLRILDARRAALVRLLH